MPRASWNIAPRPSPFVYQSSTALSGPRARPHMRFRQGRRNNADINICPGYTRAADPPCHRSKALGQNCDLLSPSGRPSPKYCGGFDQHQPRKEMRGWPETPNRKSPCRGFLWHTALLSSPCQNRSRKVGPTPDSKTLFLRPLILSSSS